eukprot:gene26943-biopygen17518
MSRGGCSRPESGRCTEATNQVIF